MRLLRAQGLLRSLPRLKLRLVVVPLRELALVFLTRLRGLLLLLLLLLDGAIFRKKKS